MENPIEDQQIEPPLEPITTSAENSPHLLIFSSLSAILLIATIGIAFIAVRTEEKQRQEVSIIQIASPEPILSSSPLTAAPPEVSYKVRFLNQDKPEIINLFLRSFSESGTLSDVAIKRWQKDTLIKLRGQPTSTDQQCLDAAMAELKPIMNTSSIQLSDNDSAPLEIYVLPKNQFTSIYVDAPADKLLHVLTWPNTDNSMHQAKILIDSEALPEMRCMFLKFSLLQGLGISNPPDPNLADPPGWPLDGPLNYTAEHKEIVSILYSDFITPGLSAEEVERRLLVN